VFSTESERPTAAYDDISAISGAGHNTGMLNILLTKLIAHLAAAQ
jgi:hypothetical protein